MNTSSSLRAFQPRYQKVKRWLEEQLRKNAWKVGEKIPGEAVLARNLEVSAITVRQALNVLAGEGFLRREKGRGTFVLRAWPGDGSSAVLPVEGGVTRQAAFKDMAFGIVLPEGVGLSRRKRRVIEALEQGISRNGGRSVVVQCSLSGGDAVRRQVLQAGGVHAAVFFEHEVVGFGEKVLPELLKSGVPVVAFDYMGSCCVSRVVEDYGWGMRLAVSHLAELGHRRILLAEFEGSREFEWMAARSHAFLDACAQKGLSVGPEDIARVGISAGESESREAGLKIGDRVCKNGSPYTAVIGINDHVALGVLEVVRGRSAPVAVVGFDNVLASGIENLTTLSSPTEGMGVAVVELLRELDDPGRLRQEGMYRQFVLQPQLICRESSRVGVDLL